MSKKLAAKVLDVLNEALSSQYKDIGLVLKEISGRWNDILGDNGMESDQNWYNLFLRWYAVAERDLKKPVVSAWFLKCVTIGILSLFFKTLIISGDKESYKSETFNKLQKRMFNLTKGMVDYKYDVKNEVDVQKLLDKFDPQSILSNLKHYLSFNLQKIDGYPYGNKSPEEVFKDLEKIVSDFQNSEERFYLKDSEEKEKYKENIEDYLVFPNGWKWVWKHVSSCKDFESKYGGERHCGTAGSSDEELLSLREPVGNGMYKIWATFSIDSDGYLVQRKGTVEEINAETGKIKRRIGNKRPVQKIHPYIYELLVYGHDKEDIKGLTSGSDYASEEDFRIEDIKDPEKRKHLESIMGEKSFYDSVFDEYESEGLTPRLINIFNEATEMNLQDNSGSFMDVISLENNSHELDSTVSCLLTLTGGMFEGFYDYPSVEYITDIVHALEENSDLDSEGVKDLISEHSYGYSVINMFEKIIDTISTTLLDKYFNPIDDPDDENYVDLEYNSNFDYGWVLKNRKNEFIKFLEAIEYCFNYSIFNLYFLERVSSRSSDVHCEISRPVYSVHVSFNDTAVMHCISMYENYDTETITDRYLKDGGIEHLYHQTGHYIADSIVNGMSNRRSFDSYNIIEEAVENYMEYLSDEIETRLGI